LLYIFFFTSNLFSQEIFLNQNWVKSKGLFTTSQSYCHPLHNISSTFCQKESLSYPVLVNAPKQKVKNAVDKIVQKEIETYKKGDLQKTVISNIQDIDYRPNGTWESRNALDLFTVTQTTFTMKNEGSGYTGGAHGYFSVLYDNYTHEGEHLGLDALLKDDYNVTLHNIAKRIYKKSAGLKRDESLEKDGWFSNTFVLAQNFAITDRGLLFHYNAYEIKPYAAGHTEFILPYHMIHSLINPEGPLKIYLKKPQKLHSTFVNDEIAKLTLSIEREDNTHLRIVVNEEVFIYAKQGWLRSPFHS